MIEKVKDFIGELLDIEYKTTILYYNEKDQNVYQESHNKLKSFFEDYLSPEISSRKNPETPLSMGQSALENKIKRVCFQIKEYDNEEYGKIYRCYISCNYNGKSDVNKLTYWQNYFVAKIDNQYKIISSYTIKSGMDEKNKFPADLTKSWDHIKGDQFSSLGKPTAVLKIQPPTHPDITEK